MLDAGEPLHLLCIFSRHVSRRYCHIQIKFAWQRDGSSQRSGIQIITRVHMTIRDRHKDGVRLCDTKIKIRKYDIWTKPLTFQQQSGQVSPQRLRYSMLHWSPVTGRKEHSKKKINYPYVVYNQISEEKMCLAKGKYSPDTLMLYGKKCCEQNISWVKDEERSEANEGLNGSLFIW